MRLSHFIISLTLIFTTVLSSNAQSDNGSVPKVFLIGEHENYYEQLVTECNTMLLSVCKDSMNVAYANWLSMLSDLESFAEANEFEINGVKIWVNVFWNGDGSIRHIVYYPKSTSRNMDFAELSAFFESFIDSYQFPVKHFSCYSHYGSATFPTFSKRYIEQEK